MTFLAPIIIIVPQFRYADFIDILMISMAMLFSMISGAMVPLEWIIHGEMFNIFISYNIVQNISLGDIDNGTCTRDVAQQFLNSIANSSDRIFCDATQEGNVINSASAFVCDPDQTLTEEVTTYSFYFVYLGVAIFVAYFLGHILWTVSASRQSKRLRIAYYKAVLEHNISWFETNDVSRLAPDYLKYVYYLYHKPYTFFLLKFNLLQKHR